MHIRPKHFVYAATAAALAGIGVPLAMTGCEGLDYSAKAEGTGVQIIGAIVVLARYHASEHQKQVAEQTARALFVQTAQPEYEKRRVAIHSKIKEKTAVVEKEYSHRLASARTARPHSPEKKESAPESTHVASADNHKPAKPANASTDSSQDEVRAIEHQKKQALQKVDHESAAELASLDKAWHSLGGPATPASERGETAGTEVVPVSSTRDRDALVAAASAHAPSYIAISVPPQGIAAEQRGKATIMLWDNRNQRLAGEDVLVLDKKPASGKTAKVDGVSAKFVSNF